MAAAAGEDPGKIADSIRRPYAALVAGVIKVRKMVRPPAWTLLLTIGWITVSEHGRPFRGFIEWGALTHDLGQPFDALGWQIDELKHVKLVQIDEDADEGIRLVGRSTVLLDLIAAIYAACGDNRRLGEEVLLKIMAGHLF